MARNQRSSRKTTRKTRRTPKPKVYIPAHKIIILCTVIITVCMLLLLGTTILSKPEQASIAARYDDSKASPVQSTQIAKQEEKTKAAKKPAPKVEKKQPAKSAEKKESKPSVKVVTPQAEKEPDVVKETIEKTPVQEAAPAKQAPEKKSFGFPQAINDAELVFVFDDAGHNINQTKAFLKLPFPYTVAVLPRLRFSKQSADVIRNSGNEVILHQPMQAVNLSVDPGEGAIKPDMTESEILSTLFTNVEEIAPIAGMNNHEGSAITADAEKMAVVLKFCSSEGIFFLDSRTNSKTAVPYVAKELGYSYFERNIFLDNEKTRDNILTELKKGLGIANKNGTVIMIGHIWSADILPDVLMEVYPELKEKGYTFSVVSKSKARKY